MLIRPLSRRSLLTSTIVEIIPSPGDSSFALAVIVGSVREGRFGPIIADWFIGQIKQRGDVSVDVIDLVDTPMPSANFAPGSAPPRPSSSSPPSTTTATPDR